MGKGNGQGVQGLFSTVEGLSCTIERGHAVTSTCNGVSGQNSV